MKKRILLIKLTSLGDLIHALPALTDAIRAIPDLTFDWLIDENFAEVATWHKGVTQVFTTNHRKWRKGIFAAIRPITHLVQSLRQTKYDLVIDGQGNFKTALMTLCMRGPTAGYDRRSVREVVASFGYQNKYSVPKKAHAIERLRKLFALSLDYPIPTTPPDFMIDRTRFVPPSIALPNSYFVFIHNASWATKLWPEAHWIELIRKVTEKGEFVLLPWGNESERMRAERLKINDRVQVLPKLSLSEIGAILVKAKATVCMDTGLSHLSAALGIPSLTLYGATDSGLIGAYGNNQHHLQSTLPCAPCNKKQCRFPPNGLHPPCLAELTPDKVFKLLDREMQASNTCNKLCGHYREK